MKNKGAEFKSFPALSDVSIDISFTSINKEMSICSIWSFNKLSDTTYENFCARFTNVSSKETGDIWDFLESTVF